MEEWDGPVPHGLEQEVLKRTPKKQGAWMASVNKARKRKQDSN